mgnify:CR=1 FL=1
MHSRSLVRDLWKGASQHDALTVHASRFCHEVRKMREVKRVSVGQDERGKAREVSSGEDES